MAQFPNILSIQNLDHKSQIIRRDKSIPPIPIIALSASVLWEERKRAFDAGISDFLPKPADLKQIVAIVLKNLRQKPKKELELSP